MEKEMTTIYGGKKVMVVGSILLTHKTTGKQKYFIVIKYPGWQWRCEKDLITMVSSEIRGMTQKKASQLPQIPYDKVQIDPCTLQNGYV